MELEFFGTGDDKIIAINYIETEDTEIFDKNDIEIKYSFGTFIRPVNFDSSHLNIIVDQNFDINEDDNVVIVDHHLMETKFNKVYKSNTYLMIEKYEVIYSVLAELANKFKYIDVYMHADVDGLCSGLIVQHILMNIFNEKKSDSISYIDDLNLVLALGNYGDIADNAKLDLDKFLNTESATELDIYDKKISKYCNSIARFMKAIRTGLIEYQNNCVSSKLLSAYNLKLQPCGLTFEDVVDTINDIYRDISNIKNVNAKSVLILMNVLAQNTVINKIVELYNEESDKLLTNYMEPVIPCMEMKIIFKNDESKNIYKLIIIDSPFDSGRSIIWKYNSSYNKLTRTSSNNVSPWYYKATDWVNSGVKTIDDIIDNNRNYACYNKMLRKLSINGTNAFDIAKNIFDGGGHMGDEENSLGSVVIEDENIFYDSFMIVDIY